METTKKAFALQLKAGLLNYYNGRMPSFSVIARDFTLRAPDLLPLSSETVRHWLRGESMPHISRMQILLEWLGEDLVNFAMRPSVSPCNKGIDKACHNELVSLCDMIHKLDQQETEAMRSVLMMLSIRHEQETT